MATLVYFSEERIALQNEILKHPELIELLQKHPVGEFEIRLAEVASYCEVILDGNYTDTDIDRLCKILTWKLIEMRTNLVLVSEGSMKELEGH